MENGQINVRTENIFPIIKKFLYSDHEIFLRELISNAVDATNKLKVLALKGEFKGELGDLSIEISIDEKEGTLTVSDNGIGMSEAEVKKYINEIAFSSAESFLNKHKDQDDTNIIGHFGLGFYSSFMVADKVVINTRSYKKTTKAVSWSCDGSPEYNIEASDKKGRGTDVIVYINDDSKEFKAKGRIKELLNKYSKFLPIEINFDGEQINNTTPAWTKNFYNELYPFSEPPLFWIHLNVDYPFNLTGILYFPKIDQSVEVQKNKIHLYSSQVFVTDEVKEIVPEFLTLLHGVIDSPDIPLNVSSSFLQSDPEVKKINSYITRKVADKLSQLFKKDREGYEQKWENINVFIKYGMLTDDKFYEKATDFCLFQDTNDKYYTIEELKKATEKEQKNKDDKLVMLYTNDPAEQHSYIKAAGDRNYIVLKHNALIDNHFINILEQKDKDISFVRVDADTIDKLIDKGSEAESILSDKEQEKLTTLFKEQINNEQVTIEMKAMSPEDQPVMITKPEFSRRMQEMAALSGSTTEMAFDSYNLIINSNHKLMHSILKLTKKETQQSKIKYLFSLARLSQNMLKGEELTSFIQQSVEGMTKKESKK